VEVQGPAGPREVDARPSDAVNLAVVTGVPIRVNAELLRARAPADRDTVRQVRLATADIAAETQQRIQERSKRPGPSAGGTETTGQ